MHIHQAAVIILNRLLNNGMLDVYIYLFESNFSVHSYRQHILQNIYVDVLVIVLLVAVDKGITEQFRITSFSLALVPPVH